MALKASWVFTTPCNLAAMGHSHYCGMLLLLFPDLGIRKEEGCDQVTWPLILLSGGISENDEAFRKFHTSSLPDLLSLAKSHSPKLNLLVQLWPWSCKEQFVSGHLS